MTSRATYFPNHHTLSVLQAGDSHHPIALFMHGIPANAELWSSVLLKVAHAGWYSLAPDCPGYGRTRMRAGADYSLKGQAALLLDWIEAEGWTKIWLIGHDLGGGVAQIMLAQRPDLFQQVTLSNCATAASWPVPIIRLMRTVARLGLFEWSAKMGLMTTPYALQKLKEAVYDASVLSPELVQRVFIDSKFKDDQGRIEFARLLRSLDNQDTLEILEGLKSVQVPVHLVWGMADPNQAWSKSGQILKDHLPHCRITQLERAGHFLMLDSEDRYVESLLAAAGETAM